MWSYKNWLHKAKAYVWEKMTDHQIYFGRLLNESQFFPLPWPTICNGSILSCKFWARDLRIGVMTMTKSFTFLFAFCDDYVKISGQLAGKWKI